MRTGLAVRMEVAARLNDLERNDIEMGVCGLKGIIVLALTLGMVH